MPQENAITIGQRSYPLTLPASFVVRREVLRLTAQSPERALAAAIVVCCPKLAAKLKVAVSGLPMDYGQAAYDALAAQGYEDSIPAAGGAAIALLLGSMPRPEAVEEAEGNSEAQTGPGT